MSTEEFQKIQAELDKAGYVTTIKKVGKKQFNVVINFEVDGKVRKQRRSCKSHIINLFNEKLKPVKPLENKSYKDPAALKEFTEALNSIAK